MTGFQAKLFCEYAGKILCIDATYRTNEYKFKLITLLVVDEYGKGTFGDGNNYCYRFYIFCKLQEGMAAAWAITDREDEPVMKVLFQAIKDRCPQAVVKNLMSDDG